jgi:hypothetical protein
VDLCGGCVLTNLELGHDPCAGCASRVGSVLTARWDCSAIYKAPVVGPWTVGDGGGGGVASWLVVAARPVQQAGNHVNEGQRGRPQRERGLALTGSMRQLSFMIRKKKYTTCTRHTTTSFSARRAPP